MNLSIIFTSKLQFEKAKDWFRFSNEESDFCIEFEDPEFRSITFTVASQEDADSAEIELTQELNKASIEGFTFELDSI